MNKTLLACSLATLSLAVTSSAHAFSLFGIEFGKTSLDTFQSHTPADSAFYIEGRFDKKSLGTIKTSQNIEAQLMLMELMFRDLESEEIAPFFDIFMKMFSEFASASESGMQDVIDRYGLAKDAASAVYLDGAMPVIQLALAKKDSTFVDFITRITTDLELSTTTRNLAGQDITSWQSDNSEAAVELLWTVSDNIFTLALSPVGAAAERQQQLLAITPETESLADTKALKALRKQYQYSDHTTGFVHLSNLAQSVLNNDSRLSKDIELLFGAEAIAAINLDATCQQEIQALVDEVPRWVFGSQKFIANDQQIEFAFSSTLEIADEQWRTDLRNLNGHLPNYSRTTGSAAIGLSLGFSGSELAPIMTQLWSNISTGSYQCEALQGIQVMAQQANQTVAAALAGSAMLNGLKGMGLALFDLQMSEENELPIVDVLVTLHAENAMTFVNLARMAAPIPELQNIVEGEVISIPVPGGFDINVLVEGDIIGVYRGDQAKAAFETERQQPLNSESLFAAAINYETFAPIAQSLLGSPLLNDGSDPYSCISNQLSYGSLSDMQGYMTLNQAFDSHGLSSAIEADVRSVLPEDGLTAAGDYQVQYLDEYCEWLDSGDEEINADGSGFYGYSDEEENCQLERYNYNWQFLDNALVVEETSVDSRDSCEQDWQNDSEHSDNYRCLITRYDNSGFECLMDYEGELTLYRYNRK